MHTYSPRGARSFAPGYKCSQCIKRSGSLHKRHGIGHGSGMQESWGRSVQPVHRYEICAKRPFCTAFYREEVADAYPPITLHRDKLQTSGEVRFEAVAEPFPSGPPRGSHAPPAHSECAALSRFGGFGATAAQLGGCDKDSEGG